MTTIDIPIQLLEACLVIAPTQEVRYYLVSVTIADGAVVATDGHRLFACELDGIDKDLQVIIPRVSVVSFIRKLDKNQKKHHARLTLEKEDSAWLTLAQVDDDGEVKLFDTKEWFKPIDSKYPAWRKVLPNQPPKPCFPYFDWRYLRDMEKISKILGASSGHFDVMVTGLNAAAKFTFPLTDYAESAVGVIMPKELNLFKKGIKMTDLYKPDWSKAPKWAGYWAMDRDGRAYWYKNKPTTTHLGWSIYSANDTKYCFDTKVPQECTITLLQILQKRPSTTNKESDMTTQKIPTFEVGQKVYFPTRSTKIEVVRKSDNGTYPLKIIDACTTEQGCLWRSDTNPIILPATQENYELLSQLYPTSEFEKPRTKLTGNEICKLLLESGKKGVACYASDVSYAIAELNKNINFIVEADEDYLYFETNKGATWKYVIPINLDTMRPYTQEEVQYA